jgi:hypothetical protein
VNGFVIVANDQGDEGDRLGHVNPVSWSINLTSAFPPNSDQRSMLAISDAISIPDLRMVLWQAKTMPIWASRDGFIYVAGDVLKNPFYAWRIRPLRAE